MILTEVWVPGHPRTKGSLTPKGKAVERSPHSARWQVLMAETVRQDIARRCAALGPPRDHSERVYPYRGPVAVWFAAWLPPTASATPAELAGTSWRGAGDVDKLARNVLDACAADATNAAMNGGAYLNDNQVKTIAGDKYTAGEHRPSGLLIRVTVWQPGGEIYGLNAAERVRASQLRALST